MRKRQLKKLMRNAVSYNLYFYYSSVGYGVCEKKGGLFRRSLRILKSHGYTDEDINKWYEAELDRIMIKTYKQYAEKRGNLE